MTDSQTLRWRYSLCSFMLVVGLASASWVSRTPTIRDTIGATISAMGMILFGGSIGSMSGILSSAYLVRKRGTRWVIAYSAIFLSTGLSLVTASTIVRYPSVVFVGLLFFGLGSGLAEIALNIDGAHIETRLKHPILPALHGCYSLGVLIGAVISIVCISLDVPAIWHLGGCSVLLALVSFWSLSGIPSGMGKTQLSRPAKNSNTNVAAGNPKSALWRDPGLILLGIVLLGLASAEGSANDWLPLIMVDGLGLSSAQGSMIFATFATIMAVGRFCGQAVISLWGKPHVLLGSLLTGALGIFLVAVGTHTVFIISGVTLWGLGVSLGFPVAISTAGENPDHPDLRVSIVATAGYCAFLVGPPVLGFLGDNFGLRTAILVVVTLLLISTAALITQQHLISQSPQRS